MYYGRKTIEDNTRWDFDHIKGVAGSKGLNYKKNAWAKTKKTGHDNKVTI